MLEARPLYKITKHNELTRVERIAEHLEKAINKHPDFCEKITSKGEAGVLNILNIYREFADEENTVEFVLLEEVYEAFAAYSAGDKAQAVDECYDAIAVLLRFIDKLEEK